MLEVNEKGECFRNGNIVTPWLNKDGYEIVSIKSKHKGKSAHASVHSLVARKYIGERPEGYTINHKDGNKRNNHVSNLEIIPHKENVRHAWEMGLCNPARGEAHGRSVLDEMKVLTIISMPKKAKNGRGKGFSNGELSRHYGVSETRISAIRNGKEWKHIHAILDN